MAIRARLVAPPPPEREEWPYHKAKIASLPVHLVWSGERRMEAENYLASGHGIRLAIQEHSAGWVRLNAFAKVWQPNRLKGTQVSPEWGTPFLAATQVFDLRPIPRKWLAVEKISDASKLSVNPGSIIVTRSGAVGRATLATNAIDGLLVSDDLLRVEPFRSEQWGWVYAYLRSPQAKAMMSSAQYGHIIKHLETSHLDALPIPEVSDALAEDLQKRVAEILFLRNEALAMDRAAEQRFEKAIGPIDIPDWGERGYSVQASKSLFTGRRRFEGFFHNPGAMEIRSHLARHGQGFTRIGDAGFEVWLPTRFKRTPATDGVWLLDSSDLHEINPDLSKRIAESDFGDPYAGRVKEGWLLLSRSGQIYGLNGTLAIATKRHEDKVVSDHIIRIAPKSAKVRVGYVHAALSHPTLGRPLVKALAYGSSIPEIDPGDFRSLELVRIPRKDEDAIADWVEEAAQKRCKADDLESALEATASELIDRFIAGKKL